MRACWIITIAMIPWSLQAAPNDPKLKEKMSAFDGSGTDQMPAAVRAKTTNLIPAPVVRPPSRGSNGTEAHSCGNEQNGDLYTIRTSQLMQPGMINLTLDPERHVIARYMDQDAPDPAVLAPEQTTVLVESRSIITRNTMNVRNGTNLYSDHVFVVLSQGISRICTDNNGDTSSTTIRR